jgi:hypothetical protein
MSDVENDVLRIGDTIEFHRDDYPPVHPEWHPQRVTEIHILEEYDDKEGESVSEVRWRAIRDYQCLVLVVGTENWGRNDDLRPVR